MSGGWGADPIKRGGYGTPAQVWAGESSSFLIQDAHFEGGGPSAIVFDLERAATGNATTTDVRHDPDGRLCRLSEGARMVLNGELLAC